MQKHLHPARTSLAPGGAQMRAQLATHVRKGSGSGWGIWPMLKARVEWKSPFFSVLRLNTEAVPQASLVLKEIAVPQLQWNGDMVKLVLCTHTSPLGLNCLVYFYWNSKLILSHLPPKMGPHNGSGTKWRNSIDVQGKILTASALSRFTWVCQAEDQTHKPL